MTPEERQEILLAIQDDPRLKLLAEAIVEVSSVEANNSANIVSLNKKMIQIERTLIQINTTLNLITNQMWIISQKPDFPGIFKGCQIK